MRYVCKVIGIMFVVKYYKCELIFKSIWYYYLFFWIIFLLYLKVYICRKLIFKMIRIYILIFIGKKYLGLKEIDKN